ncbi:MAG: branched-chain amino acid ABC transporter substrate-binding protein, partial [Microbacterium sp.]
VVYGGYYYEAGRFDKQLDRAGYKGPFLGGDGIMDRGFKAITGATIAARAHVLTGNAPPASRSSFTQAYRAAFGSAPRTNSLEAYDATKVFLAGLAAGASTRAAMLSAVDHYSAQGLTKKIAFSAKGEVIRPPVWAYKPVGSSFTVRARVQ